MKKPIDLKEVYGDKFKITIDESASHDGESKKDPWNFQIPCKFGHIYPISNKLLGFFCESSKIATKIKRNLSKITIAQEGDFEAVFAFTPIQFDSIAQYAQPRKRRRYSDEYRKELTERLSRARKQAQKHVRESAPGEQG